MDQSIPHLEFWRRFLNETGTADAEARFYGTVRDDDSMAGQEGGVEAILSGDKTASSALLADFQRSGKALPAVRSLSVLVDADDHPVAVLETTQLTVQRLADVDDAFARAHGPGQSLKSWRRQCRAAFAARARALGSPFGEDTELVCHNFRLVYVPSTDGGA